MTVSVKAELDLSHSRNETSAPSLPESYTHVAPLNSPFYHRVISPACDKILQHQIIPRWVTPNQISFCGLSFSVASVICAKIEYYQLAALFWVLYAFFDNLDGKQARVTDTSSKSGDFVDHAVDSIVASLSVLINLITLVPHGMASGVATWLTLSGQLPFYFSAWAHNVLGRVLLGTQVQGTDFFTVDEVNFLWIPGILLLRLLFPASLDHVIYQHPFIEWWTGSPQGVLTIGMTIVFLIISFSIVSSVIVVQTVYRPHVRQLLLPGLTYGFVVRHASSQITTDGIRAFAFSQSICLRPPLLVMIPSFSLMAFELLGRRLRGSQISVYRIWYPLLPFTLIGAACRLFKVEVTWGLSNAITATAALLLSCLTLSLLIRYKDALNESTMRGR